MISCASQTAFTLLLSTTLTRIVGASSYHALKALYESTDGANWRLRYTAGSALSGNGGWLNGSDPCAEPTWDWVNCSGSN
eukprot:2244910-Prymnesium_polylepis.1